LLPEVQRSTGVDDGQLGLGLLLVGVGALATMRVVGAFVDRVGGIVLPISVAALGLAGIGPGLVSGVLALSASFTLLGATSGAYDVAINAEATRLETRTGRPLLNLAHAAFSFGVIGGSLAAGGSRTIGMSLTSVLMSSGVALATVAAWLAANGMGGPEDHPVMETVAWRWWRPPGTLAFLGTLIALAFLVESAWQSWSAVHLERDLGASSWLASVGPAVFGASAGVGRVLAHRRTVPGREPQVVVAGAALAALGTAGAALVPVTALVLGFIALAGLGTAACAPSLIRLAGTAVPGRQTGAAVGTVTTIGYLGFVFAPALVGGLAGETTLPTALAAVGLAAVALAIGATRIRWTASSGPG
jgi:hypothetical protein